MRLSPSESDLLVRLSANVGMRAPSTFSLLASLEPADVGACKRLAKKGYVDLALPGQFKVNEAGIERSKQIY